MAPRTTQTIPSSNLLALFVLLGFRLGIRARVVITHAAWVVASAMARAEARTGVRTRRRAVADVQRECYVSSDASGGASGGVVGGARCGACAGQRAAEQHAQKHTRRADRELRQQRKADFPQTRRAPPRASRCARRASARPHVVRAPRAGARVRGWSEGAATEEKTRDKDNERRRDGRRETVGSSMIEMKDVAPHGCVEEGGLTSPCASKERQTADEGRDDSHHTLAASPARLRRREPPDRLTHTGARARAARASPVAMRAGNGLAPRGAASKEKPRDDDADQRRVENTTTTTTDRQATMTRTLM